ATPALRPQQLAPTTHRTSPIHSHMPTSYLSTDLCPAFYGATPVIAAGLGYQALPLAGAAMSALAFIGVRMAAQHSVRNEEDAKTASR
ncbi:hypothetical protein D3260_16865, partial [Salinisphaera sp. Q1T1-3]